MTAARPPKSPLDMTQNGKGNVYGSQATHSRPPGSSDADGEALRAHRTPLHSTQVITCAVERAVIYREPLAALVALHLLHLPATTNEQAKRTHETPKALCPPPCCWSSA